MQVNDETVALIEESLGMGHGAWDMIDPQAIINAVLEVTKGKPCCSEREPDVQCVCSMPPLNEQPP